MNVNTRVLPVAAGVVVTAIAIGQLTAQPSMRIERPAVHPAVAFEAARNAEVGAGVADIVTTEITDVENWDAGEFRAYAAGTTSCNIGTVPLEWSIFSPEHPVIAQHMYRLRPDSYQRRRFEQIGQSWLKHGACALDQSLCGTCVPTGCGSLGVGCSDPYSASENGLQPTAGPKFQVNASTGEFVYPPADPPYNDETARRLRVHRSEVDAASNPGTIYFIEAHYVHPQDNPSTGDRASNNASYRQLDLAADGEALGFIGETQAMAMAIEAWQVADPEVQIATVTLPGEGTIKVAQRSYWNRDGTWDYEYAVQNLDVDRSIGSFSVPVPAGVNVTQIGFHDVDYHSGEPISGADWQGSVQGGAITWSTEPEWLNPNANAIRWGNLYNFRFTADRAPGSTAVDLGLFKPGTPSTVTAMLAGPTGPLDACPPDLNGDGEVGLADLILVLADWGVCSGCNGDLDGTGEVTFFDLVAVLTSWGVCSE